MNTFAKFVTSIVLMILLGIYRGVVLSFLWNWFASLALDVHPIGVSAAIGVSLLSQMFINGGGSRGEKKKEDESLFEHTLDMCGHSFVTSSFTWIFGYVLHHYFLT